MAGFLVTSGTDTGDLEAWGTRECYSGFLKYSKKKSDRDKTLDSKNKL